MLHVSKFVRKIILDISKSPQNKSEQLIGGSARAMASRTIAAVSPAEIARRSKRSFAVKVERSSARGSAAFRGIGGGRGARKWSSAGSKNGWLVVRNLALQ